MPIPRPEHPRPQFVRADWLSLNGPWQFEIDAGDSGIERGLLERDLEREILVPFCPESELSGIGERDFLQAVWYRRRVEIPASWTGRRVLLHFQAVDHDTTVWVDGVEVARHRGGWSPFSADLGRREGELEIVVRARDRKGIAQARGKQSDRYDSYGCLYTRTTGIWQTVWLEAVPESSLLRPRITPDLAKGAFHLEVGLRGPRRGLFLRAQLADGAGLITTGKTSLEYDFSAQLTLAIPTERRRLWSPADPFLYDLTLELVTEDGEVVDATASYAGLRSLAIEGKAVLLNGEPVFQRLVLDQGYYPDGVMTAPSDEALARDIELSQAAGFNGARLHQKVFEERFLYHADRLGYLVWGEFGDWGAGAEPPATFITQWLEVLERDYSHPAIVGWCALNEQTQTLGDEISVLDDVMRGMFLAAKAFDQTRPVLDTSGWSHRVTETDVYDAHNYEQDASALAEALAGLANETPYTDLTGATFVEPAVLAGFAALPWSIPYRGKPYFVSEFGGTWWNPEAARDDDAWGYGARPKTVDEFYERFEGLCTALLDDPNMFGYCYTQLTDIYPELNGIYFFDRSPKFDLQRLYAIQTRRAAIEERDSVPQESR